MNKIEFYNIFKKLCEYYNNKIYDENKELTALYYEAVKDKSQAQFKEKIKKLIMKFKFMPKVADFLDGKRQANFTQRQYSEDFLESLYDNL